MSQKINKIDIANKLRKALESRTESLNAIAELSGVDVAALCRFKQGGSLKIESVEKLAGFLGFTLTKDTKPRGGK
jgi:transcriptional regulator with XRE-family HTH domain